MDINDSSYDPYVNYYQTPKKKDSQESTVKSNGNARMNRSADSKRVFNPYQKQEEKVQSGHMKDEELPEYVDLDKNVYAEKRKSTSDQDDELPLLEELGISPVNIKQKLISVLTFHKIDKQILEDADMAGPILVFILFGISLVLVSEIKFICIIHNIFIP